MTEPIQIETRIASEVWPLADLEFRADGDGLHFSGYAAVFNSDSQPLPFIETIRPGAFAKTLTDSRSKKKLYLNHNTDNVLASTAKGTLALAEDKHGLRAEADLPPNEWGRPVADAIRRGDIDSMSFGFNVVQDLDPDTGDKWRGGARRELVEVRLHEVSIVTGFPAYESTSVMVRGLPLSMPDTFRDALAVLASPDALLTDEQIELLQQSIASHRAGPTPAQIRAQWAERFALP